MAREQKQIIRQLQSSSALAFPNSSIKPLAEKEEEEDVLSIRQEKKTSRVEMYIEKICVVRACLLHWQKRKKVFQFFPFSLFAITIILTRRMVPSGFCTYPKWEGGFFLYFSYINKQREYIVPLFLQDSEPRLPVCDSRDNIAAAVICWTLY